MQISAFFYYLSKRQIALYSLCCHPSISYNLSNLFSSNLATSNFKASCAKERACASLEELLALKQNERKLRGEQTCKLTFMFYGLHALQIASSQTSQLRPRIKLNPANKACATHLSNYFSCRRTEKTTVHESLVHIWIF